MRHISFWYTFLTKMSAKVYHKVISKDNFKKINLIKILKIFLRHYGNFGCYYCKK
jgi:hypothetical protein